MPKQKKSKSEYEVGYKKPPKQHQFKKGQSGNPNGRPKHSKNLRTLIREELDIKVMLTENGQQFKLSKAQAMTKRLVNEALNGNLSAIKTLITIAGPEESHDPIFELGTEHETVFNNLMKRLQPDSEAQSLNSEDSDTTEEE